MEETVILEVKIDQGAAQKQLEQSEKNLINLKDAQRELRLEYNKGNITQTQYVQGNLKLQNAIKKETDQKRVLVKTIETESNSRNALKLRVAQLTKEYDNLNKETAEGAKRADDLEKELSQLNSQLTKGNKAAGLFKNEIGNYPGAFQNAASSIRVAGVSVADIGAKLTSFLNPATAAVGVLSGLVSVYAKSTQGAKDLEFAQNQLGAAVNLVSNAFAAQISSAEDGEGLFASLLNSALSRINPTIQALSKLSASLGEELEDLGREELDIRAGINERLEENQELLTKIADEEESIINKLNFAKAINANLVNSQAELVDLKEKELANLTTQLGLNRNNESLQTRVKQTELEINQIKSGTAKKIEQNNRLQDDLNVKLREQERIEASISRLKTREEGSLVGAGQSPGDIPTRQPNTQIQIDALAIQEDVTKKRIRLAGMEAEAVEASEKRKEEALIQSLRTAAGIFDEQSKAYQILATIDASINTYKAANLALSTFPPPFSYLAAATTIAAGLANVAKIQGFEFAEGGYTGPGGKYQPAGIVHAGEVVWNQQDVAKVGGPAAANAMRPTAGLKPYADGGFVTNRNTESSQQALIMANALKNLPPVYASWSEGSKLGRRIEFRENLAKI